MQLLNTVWVRLARRTFAGMLRLSNLCLLLLIPIYGQAQSPAPLPNPDLTLRLAGSVCAVVVLPDGSQVIGGVFEEVDGIPPLNTAKLGSEGTLNLG